MSEKPYTWAEGAALGEHSKKKHQIFQTYIREYLSVRCSLPQQSRFRIAFIDGFAGAGAYSGGELGSPLLFLETLLQETERINLQRKIENMAQINFECFCVLNDLNREAIELLKQNVAPLLARCDAAAHLNVKVAFLNEAFETAYPKIKRLLEAERVSKSVFFNLDQCGNSQVHPNIIVDILHTYQSAEVLLTFAAQSMFTYLSRNNPDALKRLLQRHGVDPSLIEDIGQVANKREWRAAIERVVFDAYRRCGPYVSPFAINNPDGWLYWLMHFANEPKARQVYNDLLHENPGVQGHYGRSGLRMLSYDPRSEGQDYLFAEDDRKRAYDELMGDIPRAVAEFGDTVSLAEFYRTISNDTPAHSADVAQAMIDNPDLSIVTQNGGERRSANGIHVSDVLVLRPQRSLFIIPPMKRK